MIGTISKVFAQVIFVAIYLGVSPADIGAQDITACGVVNGDNAQKFVGGPLDVKETASAPIGNAPGAYSSVCTYVARGTEVEKALTAPRLLDLTLHFLDSPDSMSIIFANSVIEYNRLALSPEAPFKNATITPLPGFGDKAFVFEAITDPKSGYKSALIVFYKGRIGGSIAAWKKPEPALETSKVVLQFILSRLP
ncbi:MAG: hypothetical protein ACXW6T_05410 [Candidatus Binatia bacterium]